MVQVKKPAINDAIIASAATLFSAQGYNRTTLAAIADGAGIGVGSIYSYFPSKLHILYRIYRPWLAGCIDELAAELDGIVVPRTRLLRLLLGFWRDIPAKDPGLANSLMEALASVDPGSGKPDDLLLWTERRVTEMLLRALPAEQRALLHEDFVAHLILMAYDGFVINRRLGDIRDVEGLSETVCDILLGSVGRVRRPASRPAQVRAKRTQSSRSRKTA